MAARLARRLTPKLLGVLLLPFALASCVLTPGTFVSTLRIDADRHFTFTYVGEVIAVDLGGEFAKGMKDGGDSDAKDTDPAATDDEAPTLQKIAKRKPVPKDTKPAEPDGKAATDAKNRAIAATLAKEIGYRKVTYLGDGKFSIDYAISGTLDRGFLWPYNLDAEVLFPFIALEVRTNNTVRIKAPGYANQSDASKGLAGGMTDKGPTSQLDGTFTLDTDAEIVSQNQEEGAVTTGTRKTVTWKATPTTKDAPTAVLRFK